MPPLVTGMPGLDSCFGARSRSGRTAGEFGALGKVEITVERIRALEPQDVPAIAAIWTDAFPESGSDREAAEAFLRSSLLESPWFDSEIPSLVAEDPGGRVVGFIGSNVRRFEIDGVAIRAACCAHLAVEPARRTTAAGAFLLRRYMHGPQDFTFSDTANDAALRMWVRFGGHVDGLRSLQWMRVLRPAGWTRRIALRLMFRRPITGALVPVPVFPYRAALEWRTRRDAPADDPPIGDEELTVDAVLEHLPEIAASARLRPAYDRRYVDWLFPELARTRAYATPVRRLVRRGSEVLGWYVYRLRPGQHSRVLQVLARERDVDAVLGNLFQHAKAEGASVLTGRMEPHLAEALKRQRVTVGFGERHVTFTRSSVILDALASGRNLVTRLDGEWW